jgi:hypothetical protein
VLSQSLLNDLQLVTLKAFAQKQAVAENNSIDIGVCLDVLWGTREYQLMSVVP